MFRDNPCFLGYRLLASAAAIELANSQGRFEDAKSLIETGAKLADALENAERSPGSEYNLWLYYRAAGKPELATRAIRRVGDHPGTYSFFLAADLLEHHDYETALRLFDETIAPSVKDSKYVRLAKVHLIAKRPDGEARVQELVSDYLDDRSPLIRRWALMARCLRIT